MAICIFSMQLQPSATLEEIGPEGGGLEVVFKKDTLEFTYAPVFEKDCTIIKTFSTLNMDVTIYQLPDDSNYYLHLTLAGINYDMGLIGYLGTTIETFADSIIQESRITAPYPIYILNRNDSFDILTATYFTIQENVPVLLYTIPGKGAEEYDVDQDGQMETITNGGLSTSINYWLYEWDIASGVVWIADFREQLSCDIVAFDVMQDVFIACRREDNGWREISYCYKDRKLEEVLSIFRTIEEASG